MNSYDPDGPAPSMAAERTDLAWHRSGLSLLGCGMLILRGISRPPLTAENVAIGLAVLALGAATAVLGVWHARRRRRRRGPATMSDLLPIALGTGLVGAAAFLVAAFA